MRKSSSSRLREVTLPCIVPQWGTESAWSRSGLPSTGENETTDLRKCSLSTGCRAQDRGGETQTVGFLQLGEERTQKDLTAVCKYLKEQCRAARASLFSEVHSDSTRGSIHTQKHRKFHCNGEGKADHCKSGQILMQTVLKVWGAAQSLTEHGLDHLFHLNLLWAGCWIRRPLVPSNLNYTKALQSDYSNHYYWLQIPVFLWLRVGLECKDEVGG